ncbi:hypothetical protein KLEP7_gp49 [Pseudaeromonas phage vB_PpeM_ KLEP7]|nr:hypothetical protein KLEP7_gp49 [Pseudaeromonas phage vB_PpeM_ KLEP7]
MNQQSDYFYPMQNYFNETNLINEKQSLALIFGFSLNKYFIDPEHPTQNEITLFELEHGADLYNNALSYWTIVKHSKTRNK